MKSLWHTGYVFCSWVTSEIGDVCTQSMMANFKLGSKWEECCNRYEVCIRGNVIPIAKAKVLYPLNYGDTHRKQDHFLGSHVWHVSLILLRSISNVKCAPCGDKKKWQILPNSTNVKMIVISRALRSFTSKIYFQERGWKEQQPLGLDCKYPLFFVGQERKQS